MGRIIAVRPFYLFRAVFITDEDRRAVTVEIPIHPVFLEKTTKGDFETMVSSTKTLFVNDKTMVSSIKPLFEEDQTIVSNKRTVFDAIVDSMSCKERVKNNIWKLYQAVGDDIFGCSDIMKIIDVSEAPAGDLIKRMKQTNLIEPVTGYGKGKYKFL